MQYIMPCLIQLIRHNIKYYIIIDFGSRLVLGHHCHFVGLLFLLKPRLLPLLGDGPRCRHSIVRLILLVLATGITLLPLVHRISNKLGGMTHNTSLVFLL